MENQVEENQIETKIKIEFKSSNDRYSINIKLNYIDELCINLKRELESFKKKDIDDTISLGDFSLSKIITVRFYEGGKFYPFNYKEAKDILELLESYKELENEK
jgi:hypothetical protein